MAESAELAKEYALVNNTQHSTGLFLLDRLSLQPGERVLDVGCGPGNLTEHICNIVGPDGKVVGIDPSAERVAIARDRSRANLTFYEGRAEDLSRFADASFDLVYVNSTLHWVHDQPAAAAEFARVLRSGGRLGISGGSGDYEADHERIKATVLAREPYKNYVIHDEDPKFLKRAELESILDRAGFSERRIEINKIVKTTKDGYAMTDWLDASSSGKTYGGMPPEMRPMAREEMKAEWDKMTTEDGLHMVLELLVTVAIRD